LDRRQRELKHRHVDARRDGGRLRPRRRRRQRLEHQLLGHHDADPAPGPVALRRLRDRLGGRLLRHRHRRVGRDRGEPPDRRGSRTFLTSQDADFHYRGFPGPIDDGPRGFLIDAVNRAASGAGLGIVSLPDGFSGTGSLWWTAEGSFLKAELEGFNQYFQDDSVFLGVGQEGFPVNEGLTSAGLSNWSISSHAGFLASIPGYETIDFEDAGSGGRAITIVTEGFADAPTDPTDPDNPEVRGEIPLPAPVAPLALGLAGLGVLRGRRKAG